MFRTIDTRHDETKFPLNPGCTKTQTLNPNEDFLIVDDEELLLQDENTTEPLEFDEEESQTVEIDIEQEATAPDTSSTDQVGETEQEQTVQADIPDLFDEEAIMVPTVEPEPPTDEYEKEVSRAEIAEQRHVQRMEQGRSLNVGGMLMDSRAYDNSNRTNFVTRSTSKNIEIENLRNREHPIYLAKITSYDDNSDEFKINITHNTTNDGTDGAYKINKISKNSENLDDDSDLVQTDNNDDTPEVDDSNDEDYVSLYEEDEDEEYVTNSSLPVLLEVQVPVPKNFRETKNSIHKDRWIEAMKSEINSIMDLGVLKMVPAPTEKVGFVRSKWVYALKTNTEGHVTRFKAR